MPPVNRPAATAAAGGLRAFRIAVVRGLAVLAPPLLTIVILLWIASTLNYYIFAPLTTGTRNLAASWLADVRSDLPGAQPTSDPTVLKLDGEAYKQLKSGQYIPLDVYNTVVRHSPGELPPTSGVAAYRRWIELTYLRPWIVVPLFTVVFVVLMYLLGSLFAAGLGRALFGWFERGIGRLPLVRRVYESVKQVTEYLFNSQTLDFTRVVAVEYPCPGVWTLAFVTGQGMPAINALAGEPTLTVMFPTNPMPFAGTIKMVPKSEVLDVDMTIEQAVEYIVSCGVVVPPQQLAARQLAIESGD